VKKRLFSVPLLLSIALILLILPSSLESETLGLNSEAGKLVGVCVTATAKQWVNYGDWLTEERIEMIKQAGPNIVVLMMSSWAWDNNPVSPFTGVTHRNTMIQIVNSLKSKGLMVIIQAHTNTQGINDFTSAVQGELIMDNPPSSQDSWIASWSDVIRTLKPDGIVIMNEPPSVWDTAYKDKMTVEEFSRHYWDFATRMCKTYHAIDPNIRLHVMSCPFWRMDFIVNVNSPIEVPNVIYEWHYYPFLSGGQGAPNTYLDQLYAQDKVEEAAAYIEDFLLNTGTTPSGKQRRGLKTIMDRGLPLFCGEMGIDVYTCVNDPKHWKDRMRALYAFMDKYDLDYAQNDFFRNPWSSEPDQIYRCGILNADGTNYNEIGKLWLENMLPISFGKADTNHTWKQVSFSSSFDSMPVIVASIMTENEADNCHMDLGNPSVSGFQVRVEEDTSCDGYHVSETIGWIAIKPGVYTVNDKKIIAGTVTADRRWKQVIFSSDFSSTPVIVAVIMTENEPDNCHVDLKSPSSSGFWVRVEEDVGMDGRHTTETIGWIALEPGTYDIKGAKLLAGKIDTNHNWATVDFPSSFGSTPTITAEKMTENGGDNCHIDLKNPSPSSFQVRVEEDCSCDGKHVYETIGWVAIG